MEIAAAKVEADMMIDLVLFYDLNEIRGMVFEFKVKKRAIADTMTLLKG
jgi:hypothetical protein